MVGMIKKMLVPLMMLLVAGCGGDNAFTTPGGTSGGVNGQPTVTLALTNSNGASTTSIAVDSPGALQATVRDSVGNPVSGAVVTFTAALATFNPTAGSVLTNSSGIATITLLAGTTTGADTVTADVTVNGTAATGSLGYTVAAPSVSLSSLTLGTSTLSANGTTSLTVSVLDGNGAPYTTPVTVTFASNCSAIGKATIGSPITTINGVATSNYLDKGCANTDTITASLTLGGTTLSSSANLVVQPASAGSIQFDSASPVHITLKGTGGAGLQETSTVKFRVVDGAGNALSGATVNFSLSTTIGGITFTPSTASSDTNGDVSTTVSSGSIATAVRVIATVAGSNPVLATQSDQLYVSTGVAAQDHFSLSASTHAIEGWNYDGVTTSLNVILSDHFSNPVPDGTAVTFIAEGAQVGSACATVDGKCSVNFTSGEIRPNNGRITVLAYGVGEEGFTDMDGDGYVSSSAELVDANHVSTDMPDAWLDSNENDSWDTNETPIIFDNTIGFNTTGDGKYNGVLCKSSSGLCGSKLNINVRRNQVIVLSGSAAFIKASTDPAVLTDPDQFNAFAGPIALDHCTTGIAFANAPKTVYLQITDLNGNTMPTGTTVSAATTNGTVEIAPASPVLDSTGCVRGDSEFTGCPAGAPVLPASLLVLTSDATQDATLACTNSKTSGFLTINVTTPKGVKTSRIYTVTD